MKKHRMDIRAHFKKITASLTVEAAFAFSIFFFTIYIFWQCFLLVFYEMSVADKVGEACRNMQRYGYASRKLSDTLAENMALIYLPELLGKVKKPEMVRNLIILSFPADEGNINILVKYDFVCAAPLMPEVALPVQQAFRVYPFIGTGQSGNEEKPAEEGKTVYVTETGKVYHVSRSCTYLRMNVSCCGEEEIDGKRSLDGCKYYECSDCKDAKKTGQVYFTDYGERYHYSVSCSNIYRNVLEINIDDVGSRKACSKCGGEE